MFRIRERVNAVGYSWFYVQQKYFFWWGLPAAAELQQAHYTSSGGRMGYKEFRTLEAAKEAVEHAKSLPKQKDEVVCVIP
jgi:hypothetical protein